MITVDIVTPTKKLVEGAKTDSVRVPGHDGELQILPGHRELITLLSTGILAFTENGRERKFAVSYGFAEIHRDRVLILAETAEEGVEVDKVRAETARKRAEEKLVQGVLDEHEFKRQQMKLQRAIIRQTVSM